MRYIENSVLDTSNPRSSHLVVTNDEPYPFELPPPEPTSNNVPVVNNARLSTATNAGASGSSSGAGAGAGAHTYANEKNVNIDRFKLGEEQQQQSEGACAMSEEASSHRYEEVDDEDDYDDNLLSDARQGEKKDFATDVNLYYDAAAAGAGEESPSKEKNNAKLADYYSKGKTGNKPNVNLVINNTFEPEGYRVEDEEQQDDDDEETDPKTLVRMEEESCGAGRRDGGFDDDFVGNS